LFLAILICNFTIGLRVAQYPALLGSMFCGFLHVCRYDKTFHVQEEYIEPPTIGDKSFPMRARESWPLYR